MYPVRVASGRPPALLCASQPAHRTGVVHGEGRAPVVPNPGRGNSSPEEVHGDNASLVGLEGAVHGDGNAHGLQVRNRSQHDNDSVVPSRTSGAGARDACACPGVPQASDLLRRSGTGSCDLRHRVVQECHPTRIPREAGSASEEASGPEVGHG